jgi:hypothetical protein
VREAGHHLGDTPAARRAPYLGPRAFERFEPGRAIAPALTRPGEHGDFGRPAARGAVEAAVLDLLGSRAARSEPTGPLYARRMTEIASPYITRPRVLVLGVQPGSPPFRIVEIDGQVVGEARGVTDVLQAAAAFGITVHDLDDPEAVRWVGGDKFTWTLH